MRVTVLSQYARGVGHYDEATGARLLKSLERIKWLLWHGNQYRVRQEIGFFEDDVCGLELDYPHIGKFARATHEFATYIADNAASLINYGERFRAGERISSCLAESTVNAVISKRFASASRCNGLHAERTCCCRHELGRLTARSGRCSSDGIPGLANDNAGSSSTVSGVTAPEILMLS